MGGFIILPVTDDSVDVPLDAGEQENVTDPGKPETTDDLDTGSGMNCLQSDSRVIPSRPKDSQDRVCTADRMPSDKDQLRSTSTLSISSAPPNVSEIVTQVRTRVGRLVRPVNRLIQNMTQRTSHNAVKESLVY